MREVLADARPKLQHFVHGGVDIGHRRVIREGAADRDRQLVKGGLDGLAGRRLGGRVRPGQLAHAGDVVDRGAKAQEVEDQVVVGFRRGRRLTLDQGAAGDPDPLVAAELLS